MRNTGLQLTEMFTAYLECLSAEKKEIPSFKEVCKELKVGRLRMNCALVRSLGWSGKEIIAKYQKDVSE